MWKSLSGSTTIVGALLMAAAGVSPTDAASNLAAWAKFIGVEDVQFLNTPIADEYGIWVGGLFCLFGTVVFFYRIKCSVPNVWVLDAAHYMETGDWGAEKVVGYGKEIMRLRNEGTTLWKKEMNFQTGEAKDLKLTPEEEALAIRNTRLEKVNTNLDKISHAAALGLPIWSTRGVNKPRRIKKDYWQRYGFSKISDLKMDTLNPDKLVTKNTIEPHDQHTFDSLKTNKAEIEKLRLAKST